MSAERRLVVFGAGGHGKVVADVGRSAGFVVVGFLDDAPGRVDAQFFGLPVVRGDEYLAGRTRLSGTAVALGIGDNAARQRTFQRLRIAGVEVATLIHASAAVAPSACLGTGTVVMALAAVNPDASVGDGVILNTGSVVEHDCRLGDFVHLSPNVALGGAVEIGDRTHLGLGAVALPGVRIGVDVRVGAGAAVIQDVRDGITVVGVPARAAGKGRL